MVAHKTTGKRASYGPEIDGMLSDYCAAVDGLAERNLVRAAIRSYIKFMVAENKEIGARYDKFQKARRDAADRPNLQVVKE